MTQEPTPPHGKVALVTGASRGIGREVALRLARSGAVVAGTATTQIGADAISEMLRTAGLQGAGFVMDVGDSAQVEQVYGEIQKAHGDVLILVNNAGITRDGLILRMRESDWSEVVDTDLTSVFRLCKLAVRTMIKARWGRIVNVSSVVGATGNAGQTNYAAAKAGMVGFSKSLAREIGARGVTVNCVAPGFIDTDMTRALGEDVRKSLLAGVPVGRFGTSDEVAACVEFLVSADAGYITGATLHVNGGMHMD